MAAVDPPAGVTIRHATMDDSDFLGELLVEGFRSKFEFAVGKDKLEGAKHITATLYRNVKPEQRELFFSRQFIAECDGQLAGAVQLVTSTDSKIDMDVKFKDFTKEIGIMKACRLMYFFWLCEEDVAKDAVYIDHICVREEFRGRGIGKVLMETAEHEARKLHAKVIYLMVASDNRAKHLYERQGYHVTTSLDRISAGIAWTATGKSNFYRMDKQLN